MKSAMGDSEYGESWIASCTAVLKEIELLSVGSVPQLFLTTEAIYIRYCKTL
ncbi:MAG: hypothetical protein RMI56_03480 [Sulfolobales archaeon]|nr:hypothetical protein [Sulfolobales archaeon]MDW8082842.1 hypothetical protein [Sulfolobales archaeon]